MADRKGKYAEKAMDVFRHDGLRLSLDEIAGKIGVTKKTLYNHFESKEELLGFCIHSFVTEMKGAMHIMVSDDLNAIEALRRGTTEMGTFFRSFSPVFMYDLKKLYPEIANTEHSTGFGFFLENVKQNIIKGKKENIYKKDTDVELISQYFVFSMVSFFLNHVLNEGEISAHTYFNTVVDYHLNAISTDHGRELLKEIKSNK